MAAGHIIDKNAMMAKKRVMLQSSILELERKILEGDIRLESHAPLIRDILNEDSCGYWMVQLKHYFQLIFGGTSKYWEYEQGSEIRITNSSLEDMYQQYIPKASRQQIESTDADILIFSFQGNVSECLPRFHLCNTRMIPKFAGSGIYKELVRMGYKASLIQFRSLRKNRLRSPVFPF